MSDEEVRYTRNKMEDIFSTCQKHYHSLVKFIHIVRRKVSKPKNTRDLFLLDISEDDKDVYSIMHRNRKICISCWRAS